MTRVPPAGRREGGALYFVHRTPSLGLAASAVVNHACCVYSTVKALWYFIVSHRYFCVRGMFIWYWVLQGKQWVSQINNNNYDNCYWFVRIPPTIIMFYFNCFQSFENNWRSRCNNRIRSRFLKMIFSECGEVFYIISCFFRVSGRMYAYEYFFVQGKQNDCELMRIDLICVFNTKYVSIL